MKKLTNQFRSVFRCSREYRDKWTVRRHPDWSDRYRHWDTELQQLDKVDFHTRCTDTRPTLAHEIQWCERHSMHLSVIEYEYDRIDYVGKWSHNVLRTALVSSIQLQHPWRSSRTYLQVPVHGLQVHVLVLVLGPQVLVLVLPRALSHW